MLFNATFSPKALTQVILPPQNPNLPEDKVTTGTTDKIENIPGMASEEPSSDHPAPQLSELSFETIQRQRLSGVSAQKPPGPDNLLTGVPQILEDQPKQTIEAPSDSSVDEENSDQAIQTPSEEYNLSNEFKEYFGDDSYESSKSGNDNVLMKIIQNRGHFPSMDGKQLCIPPIVFQSSTDLEISECHFPKEVKLENSSFSGIKNVYIENGTAILKTPDSHLFVNSKDAVGRSIIDKTTIIASNGARAIVSEGGTAIAIDNKSTLARAGYHPDNRLEAREAGTLIEEFTDNGDKFSYITTKNNYVCTGNQYIENGIYEDR